MQNWRRILRADLKFMRRRPGMAVFRWSFLAVACLLLNACVSVNESPPAECHAVYDAGSSSTRLFVYQLTTDGWLEFKGSSSTALADPLRSIRGKTADDMPSVVGEMVDSLQEMKDSGQLACHVASVSVLATAGMRIAEQQFPAASRELWTIVEQAFTRSMDLPATGRTISGFEEGLYAWIAEREQRSSNAFGLVEMGGASFQVSFPCQQCAATRDVIIGGQAVKIVSRSFSGWGQDEAWVRHKERPACASGLGRERRDWQANECLGNLPPLEQLMGTMKGDMRVSGLNSWYTTGAFKYSRPDDVERFCRLGEVSDYQPESACFRAAYLQSVLEMLGLGSGLASTDAEWTLGAAICAATRCLEIK